MSRPIADDIRKRAERRGLQISDRQIAGLALYFDLLRHWNRTTNLTALPLDEPTAPTVDRLLIEPLIGARLLRHELAGTWIDVGSGGGSPALPIRVVTERFQLTMVESRGKKASFLREAVRVLEFSNVEVIADRFEILATRPAGSMNLITSRAVKLDQGVMDVIAHLLAPGGQLLSFGHQEVPLDARLVLTAVGEGDDMVFNRL